MGKVNIIIYVHENKTCTRLHAIFNHLFRPEVTYSREEFLHRATNGNIDVGILCYCYADVHDIRTLVELKEQAVHIPLIVCSKIPNPDFISLGAKRGLDHFLLCNMPQQKIADRILTSIRSNGLRVFIERQVLPGVRSPYTHKIISELLHVQPEQPSVAELATALGISSRWLQSLFQEIFGITFTVLMRRVHVYQSLNLMRNSRLDNTEIAMKLSYSEENSLYRIFRKELGYSPTRARELLADHTPAELLN